MIWGYTKIKRSLLVNQLTDELFIIGNFFTYKYVTYLYCYDVISGWAPFTVNTVGTISRYSVVDFLPIMGNPKMAIYIPREMAVEEIDWKLYFTPFISDLWQMLLVSSVVLAISLYLMEYIKLGKRPVCIVSKYIPYYYKP